MEAKKNVYLGSARKPDDVGMTRGAEGVADEDNTATGWYCTFGTTDEMELHDRACPIAWPGSSAANGRDGRAPAARDAGPSEQGGTAGSDLGADERTGLALG